MSLCVCRHQLQPHRRMKGVCPVAKVSRDLRSLEGAAILRLMAPPEHTRLVLMSDELMDVLARPRDGYSVTWQWGEPDENGWYTPTFTEHEDSVA